MSEQNCSAKRGRATGRTRNLVARNKTIANVMMAAPDHCRGRESFWRLCASGRDGGGHLAIRLAKATWECAIGNLAQLVAAIRSKI